MDNNDFLLLVSKKLSGEALDAEVKELENLIAVNPELNKQYKLLQQFWEQQQIPNETFVEDSLQKVLHQLQLPVSARVEIITKQKRKVFSFTTLRIAAAVLILVLSATFFFLQSNKTAVGPDLSKFEKKQNSKGTKSTIELSDGSKVWLNADSKIEYPPVFAGNTREIYLKGEAFFEVAKNPAKPFIIHLANGTVRVVGTSFNIRAYENEKVVETSVATGKVAFIPKYKMKGKAQDTVFITPDNKVRYLFAAEKITVTPTLAKDDKAWTEGKLIFRAMSLQDIATELERNFGKKPVFLDPVAKDYILTGSFQNNTLEEILYYLSLSKAKKFYYKITNNELLIASDTAELQD